MVIYLGADHGGFSLKERFKKLLSDKAYEVIDLGAKAYADGDDYPDYASEVARRVAAADPDAARGILFCRSGAGVDIVANKFRGIRSALAVSTDQIYSARHDDDVNVLCIAVDFTEEADLEKIVQVFLATPFAREAKYMRRIAKIDQIESDNQIVNH